MSDHEKVAGITLLTEKRAREHAAVILKYLPNVTATQGEGLLASIEVVTALAYVCTKSGAELEDVKKYLDLSWNLAVTKGLEGREPPKGAA